MKKDNIHILSTRPVSEALIAKAAAQNIVVDVLSFIETSAVNEPAVAERIQSLAMQDCSAIFTSMNAADVVADVLGNRKPAWNIFCMGNSTKLKAEAQFGSNAIAAIGNDAVQLAKRIIAWRYATGNSSPIVFFCGDQRRDELPEIMKDHQLPLEEIITYETVQRHHVVNKHYHAVLFFSPSAVHSFFTTNKADHLTTYFAIGATTAKAIRQYAVGEIITGKTPSRDELLEEAIAWFSK